MCFFCDFNTVRPPWTPFYGVYISLMSTLFKKNLTKTDFMDYGLSPSWAGFK